MNAAWNWGLQTKLGIADFSVQSSISVCTSKLQINSVFFRKPMVHILLLMGAHLNDVIITIALNEIIMVPKHSGKSLKLKQYNFMRMKVKCLQWVQKMLPQTQYTLCPVQAAPENIAGTLKSLTLYVNCVKFPRYCFWTQLLASCKKIVVLIKVSGSCS